MARVLKGSHSFICTPTRSSTIGMSHTCFAFPAIAGTHLPTPEDWKAELAWVAGYVVRQFTCLKEVTHPTSSNQVQCSDRDERVTATLNRHQLPGRWDFLECSLQVSGDESVQPHHGDILPVGRETAAEES